MVFDVCTFKTYQGDRWVCDLNFFLWEIGFSSFSGYREPIVLLMM